MNLSAKQFSWNGNSVSGEDGKRQWDCECLSPKQNAKNPTASTLTAGQEGSQGKEGGSQTVHTKIQERRGFLVTAATTPAASCPCCSQHPLHAGQVEGCRDKALPGCWTSWAPAAQADKAVHGKGHQRAALTPGYNPHHSEGMFQGRWEANWGGWNYPAGKLQRVAWYSPESKLSQLMPIGTIQYLVTFSLRC